MQMPRDVIAEFTFGDIDGESHGYADDLITRLGEAGYEIVQRFTEAKPWWSFQPPVFVVDSHGVVTM